MSPFTFIHAADLHLGSPFQGLRSTNASVAAAADAATYRALDGIIRLAIERQAAFVLFAGDIYDGDDRNLRAQLQFRDALRKLKSAGIRAFIIHGNHDHLGGTQAQLQWPDNAHFFGSGASEPEVVNFQGEPVAVVCGSSFPRREVKESLLPHYRLRSEHAALFRIGLLHANVGDDPNHGSYAPCSVDDLVASGFDYWALGHVHRFSLLRQQHPAIVYPGTPQGLSPRETGQHGCCVVTVREDRSVAVEFVPTASLTWHALEIPIDGLQTEDQLLEEVARRLQKLGEEGCSGIARVRLTGRGPLHPLLQRPETVRDLLSEWQQDPVGEPFVWVEKVEVSTRPPLDLERCRRERQDLAGDFLRLCDTARQDPHLQAELLELVSEVFGRSDVRRDLPAPADRLAVWLEQAEALGADLLLGSETA